MRNDRMYEGWRTVCGRCSMLIYFSIHTALNDGFLQNGNILLGCTILWSVRSNCKVVLNLQTSHKYYDTSHTHTQYIARVQRLYHKPLSCCLFNGRHAMACENHKWCVKPHNATRPRTKWQQKTSKQTNVNNNCIIRKLLIKYTKNMQGVILIDSIPSIVNAILHRVSSFVFVCACVFVRKSISRFIMTNTLTTNIKQWQLVNIYTIGELGTNKQKNNLLHTIRTLSNTIESTVFAYRHTDKRTCTISLAHTQHT